MTAYRWTFNCTHEFHFSVKLSVVATDGDTAKEKAAKVLGGDRRYVLLEVDEVTGP